MGPNVADAMLVCPQKIFNGPQEGKTAVGPTRTNHIGPMRAVCGQGGPNWQRVCEPQVGKKGFCPAHNYPQWACTGMFAGVFQEILYSYERGFTV